MCSTFFKLITFLLFQHLHLHFHFHYLLTNSTAINLTGKLALNDHTLNLCYFSFIQSSAHLTLGKIVEFILGKVFWKILINIFHLLLFRLFESLWFYIDFDQEDTWFEESRFPYSLSSIRMTLAINCHLPMTEKCSP